MSGTVTILGAGAGGLAAAVDLAARGWKVRVWNRGQAALDDLAGGVSYEGSLGEGKVDPQASGSELGPLLHDSDVAMVCLPALAHEGVAQALADAGATAPVVLNPGHTGGALHVEAVFARAGVPAPPVAELSTLTYVARKPERLRLRIGDVAHTVRVAATPGSDAAIDAALGMYPNLVRCRDVLATGLSNVNLVLHPPGAILGAAWVEATHGDYRFYVDGMTPGVVRVLEALDTERRAVAAAFGHELPSLAMEMAMIGTAVEEAAQRADTRSAITGGEANSTISAPDGLGHRYYREDLAYGLVPFLAFAEVAHVPCPTAAALLELGSALLGEPLRENGLGPERLGILGLDRDQLLQRVREHVEP